MDPLRVWEKQRLGMAYSVGRAHALAARELKQIAGLARQQGVQPQQYSTNEAHILQVVGAEQAPKAAQAMPYSSQVTA